MIPLPQSDGVFPVLQHTLNKTCRQDMAVSVFNSSTGILSKPLALLFFAAAIALLTSKMIIKLSKRDSPVPVIGSSICESETELLLFKIGKIAVCFLWLRCRVIAGSLMRLY